MRRYFSILLAAFFSLSPLAPAFRASDDTSLPACCRSNGAHHCAMSEEMVAHILAAAFHRPTFTAPSHCPLYPHQHFATVVQLTPMEPASVGTPAFIWQRFHVHPGKVAEHAGAAILRVGRGPPSSLLT